MIPAVISLAEPPRPPRRSRRRPGPRGPLLICLQLVSLAWALLPTSAVAQGRPISVEEERAIAEQRKLVEQISALTFKERLLTQRPETFFRPPEGLDQTASRFAADLMTLDVLLRLTDYGGVENLDRLQTEIRLLRQRSIKDPQLVQQAIARRLKASEAERIEASRMGFTVRYLMDNHREKPTEAAEKPSPVAAPAVAAKPLQKAWRQEWLSEMAEAPAAPDPDAPPPAATAADPIFDAPLDPAAGGGLDPSARERSQESIFGALEIWLKAGWTEGHYGRLVLALAVILALLAGVYLLFTRRRRAA